WVGSEASPYTRAGSGPEPVGSCAKAAVLARLPASSAVAASFSILIGLLFTITPSSGNQFHGYTTGTPVFNAVGFGTAIDPLHGDGNRYAGTGEEFCQFFGAALSRLRGFLQQGAVAEQVSATHAADDHAPGTQLGGHGHDAGQVSRVGEGHALVEVEVDVDTRGACHRRRWPGIAGGRSAKGQAAGAGARWPRVEI